MLASQNVENLSHFADLLYSAVATKITERIAGARRLEFQTLTNIRNFIFLLVSDLSQIERAAVNKLQRPDAINSLIHEISGNVVADFGGDVVLTGISGAIFDHLREERVTPPNNFSIFSNLIKWMNSKSKTGEIPTLTISPQQLMSILPAQKLRLSAAILKMDNPIKVKQESIKHEDKSSSQQPMPHYNLRRRSRSEAGMNNSAPVPKKTSKERVITTYKLVEHHTVILDDDHESEDNAANQKKGKKRRIN